MRILNKKNTESGFIIRTVLIVIVIVILLIYFGDDLKKIIEKDEVKTTIRKAVKIFSDVWSNYLRDPIYLFWDKVIVQFLWEMVIKGSIEYLKSI